MKNKLAFLIIAIFCPLFLVAETFTIRSKTKDGEWRQKVLEIEPQNGVVSLKIPSSEIPDGQLEIIPHFARARAGEDGYMLLSTGGLIPYKAGVKNTVYIPWSPSTKEFRMRAEGMKTPRASFVAIFKKLPFERASRVSVQDGSYQLSTFYDMQRCAFDAYEDIEIEYQFLPSEDSDYSAMARAYRTHLLDGGECKAISERLTPELDYAANCVEIRIRQAWKPVPSPVENQTPENEPELRVRTDFKAISDFLKALKKAGVDKAQICLVGWNIGGHDGRWPTAFPVEPKLGGEKGLRELIALAKSLGYQIVCHTNSTDIYHISDDWKKGFPVAKKTDGSMYKNGTWGGGRMYDMCPKFSWEYAQRDLPKIADLGFKGLHYIDVISTKPPFDCHDPAHPCTRKEAEEYMNKILSLAKKLFGGSASEGGADYVCGTQDYALYVYFNLFKQARGIVERIVPFWEITFNGIMLHNTSTETVNYPIKSPESRLKLYEFGGRPLFYINSKFKDSGNNSMGDLDLSISTPEEMARTIAAIKRGSQEYDKCSRLQRLFIRSHSELSKGIFSTLYDDGTEVVSNYTDKSYAHKGVEIHPKDFAIFEP